MICTERRLEAAKVVELYRNGEIDGSDLTSRLPLMTDDRGLIAIENMLWFTYDDLRSTRVSSTMPDFHRVDDELQRMITFLRSDIEYPWSMTTFKELEGGSWLLSVLTLGATHRRRVRRFERFLGRVQHEGDWSAWPFLSSDAYQAERARQAATPL